MGDTNRGWGAIAARLDLAESRITELAGLCQRIVEDATVEVQHVEDPSVGLHRLVLMCKLSVPVSASLVLSDIVHQMRSALDNMVWQLVLANGVTPPHKNNLAFPVVEEESKYPDRSRVALKGVSDEVRSWFLRFHGFGDPVRSAVFEHVSLLSKVNNYDKHRFLQGGAALLAAPLVPERIGVIPLDDIETVQFEVHNNVGESPNGAVLYGVKVRPRQARIKFDLTGVPLDAQIGVLFGEDPTVNTGQLERMARSVRGVYEELGCFL